MSLTEVKIGYTGLVSRVNGPEKIQNFLMSLGCSSGEKITLISILAGNYIINIKDGRYAIDKKMASAIELIS